jgi:uncharacterized membrane protein YjdF
MKKNSTKTILIATAACLITYLAIYASVKSHIDFFWIMSVVGFVILIFYVVAKGFGSK